MKLLFDQNLSFRLCSSLNDLFPNSEQVRLLGMSESSDQDIWQYAANAGLTIVTQDSDFADMAAVFGPPPKVLWLRCGNQPTEYIEKLLRQHFELLKPLRARKHHAWRSIDLKPYIIVPVSVPQALAAPD